MSFNVENTSKHLCTKLEKCCSDDAIIKSQQKPSNESWDSFLEDFSRVPGDSAKRKILEYQFERVVTVYKDGSALMHRTYAITDTLMQMALRRQPPKRILDIFALYSPIYKYSRELYDLIDPILISDDEWTDVKRCLYRLCISKDHTLTDDEIEQVFRMRHGWREDTVLMLCTRRDPPLKVVEAMLDACRESIAIVDTRLYDWIPFIYAIAYSANEAVIEALIPSEEDFDSFDSLKEHNFLQKVDIYCRSPLHWSIFYGSSTETVMSVIKNSPPDALEQRDSFGNRPFELAITVGTSMKIVEMLLPNSIQNFQAVEVNILKSLIYKKTKRLTNGSLLRGTIDAFMDNVMSDKHGSEDEYTDTKRYDVSQKMIPYMANQISRKRYLQEVMITKSCHTVSTAVLMLDFYSCFLLLLSYRYSTLHYIEYNVEPSGISPWLYWLLLSVVYMTSREVCQIYIKGLAWLTDAWNYLDAVTLGLVIWCMVRMFQNEIDGTFAPVVVMGTALVWLNALGFLRSTLLRFGIFVSGLVTIVMDLIPFLIVSLLILVAFGEMYNVDSIAQGLCLQESNEALNFCTSESSLFSMYAFFVGGIELGDLSSTTTMKVISIAFGFFVAVVLLNVVIAIVSKSWDTVTEEGKEIYWRYRLQFFEDVRNYEELMPWFMGKEVTWVSAIHRFIDRRLDRVCQFFWFRSDYWGNYDSIIDRVTSSMYGSLTWQYFYEQRNATSCWERRRNTAKALIIVGLMTVSTIILFVLGMASCGIFWPPSIRKFLFGQAALAESSELEEIRADIQDLSDDMKWLCLVKKKESKMIRLTNSDETEIM